MSASDPFHHVRDAEYFELPRGIHLPTPRIPLPDFLGGELVVSKFMILQVVAVAIIFFIFTGLARRVRSGEPVKGRFWNFWEAIALFVRDQVVRPTIGDHSHDDHHGHGDHGHGDHGGHGHDAKHGHGEHHGGGDYHHPADKYLPFIWSCFFYVLICNLLGAVPFLGSATGNLNVTGALALTAFLATVIFGFNAMGPAGFFGNMMPDTGVPGLFGRGLTLGIFAIEVLGFFIKHGVLAVRLFANIMGGHTVLGVILGFIALGADQGFLWGPITLGSIGMQIFIGCLELFVAFLQAYVFSFLATIFIAGAIHKH
ncbi:MAG: F0F1 ATP synthase subunit A [Planctomyces sp.]|nr:F0F1 ATP synthase subunit A [Planctomyces sp.]